MSEDLLLRDEGETRRLAEALARALPKGSVLLLKGPMGAGKTTLVRHLAAALGFRGRVTSPTYTLLHVYPTPKGPLLHADLYRLEDPRLAEELGLFEEAGSARLTAVEWGKEGLFPGEGVVVLELLPHPEDPGARRVTLRTQDPELARTLARLLK